MLNSCAITSLGFEFEALSIGTIQGCQELHCCSTVIPNFMSKILLHS